MALSTAIRATATATNRARQRRAEARLDEIVKVAGIADDYATVDRHGDLEIEKHFAALYQLVDSDNEREAVARAFAVWQRSEQAEDDALRGSVDDSVGLLKSNNPLFIDGAYTPTDSGRSA